jgi:hypothetical protein
MMLRWTAVDNSLTGGRPLGGRCSFLAWAEGGHYQTCVVAILLDGYLLEALPLAAAFCCDLGGVLLSILLLAA